jgi:hypothetical protein
MKTYNDDAQWTSNAVAAPLEGPSESTVVVATRFAVRRRRDTMVSLRAALASAREAEAPAHAKAMRPVLTTVPLWSTREANRPARVDLLPTMAAESPAHRGKHSPT